jgi:hypothetical protein
MVSRPQSSSLAKHLVIPNLHTYRSIAKWVSKRLKSTSLVRAMFANHWRTDATTLFSLSLLILLLPCKGALHFPYVGFLIFDESRQPLPYVDAGSPEEPQELHLAQFYFDT